MIKDTIEIFYANPKDASDIAKLFIENVDESYITASEEIWGRATLKNGWNEDLYNNIRLEILNGIKEGDKIILVMYNCDKLIGYTFTAIKPNKCAEIEDFVVHKDYRRDGLGKKLYERTVEVCKKNEITTLFLEVGVNNHKMHKFCEINNLQQTSVRYWTNL